LQSASGKTRKFPVGVLASVGLGVANPGYRHYGVDKDKQGYQRKFHEESPPVDRWGVDWPLESMSLW
jgi:hypothetical protein